jgi:urea carboxylase-associated protein 1
MTTPTVRSVPAGLIASSLDPADAIVDKVVGPGDGFLAVVPAGGSVRIVDTAGNQAADTLFYDRADIANRYSAFDTIREQGNVYLTTGARLLSQRLDLLGTITADTCGRHDTIGGACSQESNVIRYGTHTRHQHACRQTFLRYGADAGIGAAEISHNINFFMNVPVTGDGGLAFEDGLSSPGAYVEVQAAREIYVLISNCPQLNNPCNGWNPTPIQVLIWGPATSC